MDKKGQQEIAIAIDRLLKQNQKLEKHASKLSSEVELLEKRAAAESILINCRNTPSKYRTSSIDDFLSKRAELETKTIEELQKIADVVNMLEVDESTGLVQLVDNVKNDEPKESFDEWVANWRDNR